MITSDLNTRGIVAGSTIRLKTVEELKQDMTDDHMETYRRFVNMPREKAILENSMVSAGAVRALETYRLERQGLSTEEIEEALATKVYAVSKSLEAEYDYLTKLTDEELLAHAVEATETDWPSTLDYIDSNLKFGETFFVMKSAYIKDPDTGVTDYTFVEEGKEGDRSILNYLELDKGLDDRDSLIITNCDSCTPTTQGSCGCYCTNTLVAEINIKEIS